jgi:isopropylmalate/homocitrate/citramalate synthase
MRVDTQGDLSTSSCNVLTGLFDSRLEQPIEILDTTLREGEQPPGVVFTADDKMEIARRLDEVGVHWVSVGFPAVSEDERRSTRRVTQAGFRFKTAALSRMVHADIDAAIDCGADAVAMFLGGSNSHLFDKLRSTEDEAVRKIEDSFRYLKDRAPRASTMFAVEDTTRTPLPRLLRMCQAAVDAGSDQITVADTLGVLTPTSTRALVTLMRALFRVPIATHFHNDLGLALANSLAALEAGAELVHVTVNGVGERCGNTCLEELAVLLRVKYGRDLGLRLDRLHELSQLVHRLSGSQPGEHKAITGRWTFTHESGIHVAGILANPESYQPFPPHLVGRHHEIVFGKHSGMQGVVRLAELAGLTLSEAGRRTVLERIKRQAEQQRGAVSEDLILEWIREEAPTETALAEREG